MFSTRPTAPKPRIKVEEAQCEIKPMESTHSGTNMPRKRAREDDEPNGTLEDTRVSGRVKVEEVPAQPNNCDHCSPESLGRRRDESQRLRDILAEAILMKDAIIEQNESLAAELCRTRHQLHHITTSGGICYSFVAWHQAGGGLPWSAFSHQSQTGAALNEGCARAQARRGNVAAWASSHINLFNLDQARSGMSRSAGEKWGIKSCRNASRNTLIPPPAPTAARGLQMDRLKTRVPQASHLKHLELQTPGSPSLKPCQMDCSQDLAPSASLLTRQGVPSAHDSKLSHAGPPLHVRKTHCDGLQGLEHYLPTSSPQDKSSHAPRYTSPPTVDHVPICQPAKSPRRDTI
ncbi:hypothetical protein FB451DRAFT_1373685 [Mycena latifolia]|nr:hypothetical protein FB451DRAFT_1373685 [Mycena latifolia]